LIILYFHIPQLADYMLPTREWLNDMDNYFKVIPIVTPKGQNRMYEGLVENWNKGEDIVICGQDNVGNLSMLLEYEKCPELICSNPCLMYSKSLGFDGLKQNMISKDSNGSSFLHEPDSTRSYCNWILGTGLSRIRKEVQEKIDLTEQPFHFQNFDYMLSKRFRENGINKYHLHYPIHEHNKK